MNLIKTSDDLIRAKCFKSFEFYTRHMFKAIHGRKFVMNEHHVALFEAAENILAGNSTRNIFNIAPRYTKTEIMVKMFISYCLALNPAARFIHLSYSDSLALDNSEEIKDIILSDEYQRLFPYVKIKKDSKAKNKWYTTEGGGVLARSAAGQVTGFGAGAVDEEEDDLDIDTFISEGPQHKTKFGGAIIIDDPIKPDDADSPTIRDKVNNKFDTTIRNRVNSRRTPIVIIMQRLHSSDLCGYVTEQDPEEWNVLSMPVIKPNGEALWPFKHTIEELKKLRKLNEFVFDTQYMQDPKPKEGLLFPKEELKRYDSKDLKLAAVDGKLGFVDVADKGTDSHSVPIGYLIGRKIYIHDVLYTTEGTDTNVDLTAKLINKHKPEFVRIESNFGGSMYRQLLIEKVDASVGLLAIHAITNKHSRITTLAGFIKEFCYFRTDYEHGSDYYKFIKNLTEYLKNGKNEHDDAPDSLQGLCAMIKAFYAHLYEHLPTE